MLTIDFTYYCIIAFINKSYLILLLIFFIFPATASLNLTSFTPTDGSTNVSYNTNFVLNFDVNACLGATSGISIYRSSNDSLYTSVDFTMGGGSMSGAGTTSVTINPDLVLESYTDYYVTVSSIAFYNCDDMMMMDYYSGFYDKNTWNFTSGFTPCGNLFQDPCKDPVDDATNVVPWKTLTLTFNENVIAWGTGIDAYLKLSSDNSLVETFYMNGTAGNVSIAGNIVTFNPNTQLQMNTAYYMEISGGAISRQADSAVMYFGTNSTTWNFSTGSQWWCGYVCGGASDIPDPTFTPLDDATGVALTSNLTMLFNGQLLHLGNNSSSITIKKTSDNSTFESISIDSPKIIFENGNFIGDSATDTRITINPDGTFASNTSYYIDIGCDAIKNVLNHEFGIDTAQTVLGVSGKTIWNFTTTSGGGGGGGYPVLVTSIPPSSDTTYSRNNFKLEFDRSVDLVPGVSTMTCSTGSYAGPTVLTLPLSSATTTATPTIIKVPSIPPGLLPGSTIFCQFSGSILPSQNGASTNPGNFQFQINLDPVPILSPSF